MAKVHLRALAETIEAPIAVVGEVTRIGVDFQRGGDTVKDLSGWDHFA